MQSGKGKVGIVGVGPVGSVMAILMAREGYQVEVFEKRADPTLGGAAAGRSVNLSLSMRAIKVFEMIGAKERILKHGIALYGRTSHNKDGCHFHQYGREGQCNFSISRHLLNNLLIEAAKEEPGVSIVFNQNLLSFDLKETSLTFKNEDGQIYTKHFEQVFGADGAFSAIRKNFITTQDFNYSQEYSDFGYLEFEVPATPEGGFYFHTNSFHLWPRFRSVLLAMPNTNGTFTCNLFLPLKGHDSFESLSKEEDFVEYMHRQFPDAAPLMTTMLDTIRNGPRGRLQDIKCYPWVFNNFCLIGDAAHAIFPFYGQGLNAGLEDCSTIIELYQEHKGDWQTITNKFQTSRKINTDAISDLSKQNFVELRDKMADQDFLLKKYIIGYLSDNYNDIYISQYSMISFSHTPYHLANAFGKVEDEIIKEIKQIPNFKELVDSKKRYTEIEEILKKYQGVFYLDQLKQDTKHEREKVHLPYIGTFEVEKTIDCTRAVYFEKDQQRDGFTCFNQGLPKKESPYPYEHLSVEKLTITPHLHMTHAETECHIKQKDGQNIAQKNQKYIDQTLAIVIEVKPEEDGQLEITLDQTKEQYLQALAKIQSQKLKHNNIIKTVFVKFNYDDTPNEQSKNITNFPYLSTQSVEFLKEKGFKIIAINTPSFDNESSSKLENHHTFFHESNDNLVIEFVDATQLNQGLYIADIGIYPMDSDAAPCTIKMKQVMTASVV